MAMLGHRTASVFRRYNITSAQDLVDGAVRLGAFLDAHAKNPQETRRMAGKRAQERTSGAAETPLVSGS